MASLSAKLHAKRGLPQRDYSPVHWTEYFDETHDLIFEKGDGQIIAGECGNNNDNNVDSFRVYLRNFKYPLAPKRQDGQVMGDSHHSDDTQEERNRYAQTPTLVMLHGGGYSALTWAEFTRYIEQQCTCRVLAIDLRDHGDTRTSEDERMDIDTLVTDVIRVTHRVHQMCGFMETPKLIIIGHSMGGAIAIKCSARCTDELPSLVGLVVIDVVEGTAKDALPLMLSVIKTRPYRFPSLENAIEWTVRSGMAKNSDAARVSMPGNLINMATGYLSIHDIKPSGDKEHSLTTQVKKHKFHISLEHLISKNTVTSLPIGLKLPPRVASLKGTQMTYVTPSKSISEEESISEENSAASVQGTCGDAQRTEDPKPALDSDGYRRPPEPEQTGYCWRTDLAKTQPHWSGWFEGLSQQLLAAPIQGKFLLLAGIDRLDKTLTIGQMQGKFMMKVLPKCGHAVHEDLPDQVASEIGSFLVRNKFTTPTA